MIAEVNIFGIYISTALFAAAIYWFLSFCGASELIGCGVIYYSLGRIDIHHIRLCRTSFIDFGLILHEYKVCAINPNCDHIHYRDYCVVRSVSTVDTLQS
jgi:hypothetical protein